jgi:cyclin B
MDNNSKEKAGDNKNNVPNSSDEKNIKQKKDEINNKENINIIQENKNNEKIEIKEEKNENKFEMDKKNIDDNEKESFKNDQEVKQKNINEENINLNKEKDRGDIRKNDDKFISSKEIIYYFDTSQINNVQIPKDYINTIYYNLLIEENKDLEAKPVHTYMKKQKEINDQMRSILVDWIIDVHHKFGFTDETLFMTILIIDRYCSLEQISRIKYQCLGITALMIACKHEEINVPKVEDFIYITDNAYTKEEVFKMENDVLSKLNFELLYPSPIKFYEYLSLHFGFSKKYHMLGKYLMETFLLDLKYVKYKPSIISCACTYIVMKFFKMSNYRQSYEKKFYLLDENINTIPIGHGVKDCAQDICIYVDNINNTNLLSCQKKYTKSEFERVATLISNNKT